ncbi:MAG: hypothetical protein AABX11_03835 [Nanoarchaeota archaeon]
MKAKKIIFFVGLGLLFVLVLFFIFINFNTLQKQEYDTTFEIGETSGFDLNTSALTFGRISFNSSSTRSILVRNDFAIPVFVSLYISGNISKLISISENDFRLVPGENKSIEFKAYSNADLGKYTGKVTLVVKRYEGLFNGKL